MALVHRGELEDEESVCRKGERSIVGLFYFSCSFTPDTFHVSEDNISMFVVCNP